MFLLALVPMAFTGFGAYTENVKPGDDLNAVRDRVRAARKAGKVKVGEAVTVTFAPGTYAIAKTLLLEAADGGAEGAPVTWRAEKPGTVTLVGGAVVPAASFGPVTDAKRRASFAEGVRDKVRVADVASLLPGELKPWPDGFKGMVCDAQRGDEPRHRLQMRGDRVTGLVFPDRPRGWNVVGEVVTPWRVTLFEP